MTWGRKISVWTKYQGDACRVQPVVLSLRRVSWASVTHITPHASLLLRGYGACAEQCRHHTYWLRASFASGFSWKTQEPFLETHEICYWKFLYFHVVSIYSKAKFYLKNWISRIIIILVVSSVALSATSQILSVSEWQGNREEGRRGDHFKIGLSYIFRYGTFSKTVVCTQTLR